MCGVLKSGWGAPTRSWPFSCSTGETRISPLAPLNGFHEDQSPVGTERFRHLPVVAPGQLRRDCSAVRLHREHAPEAGEDHEAPIRTPNRIAGHQTVGQARPDASLPVVNKQVRIRTLGGNIGEPGAVRREAQVMVACRFKAEGLGPPHCIQPLRYAEALAAGSENADAGGREIHLCKSNWYIGSNFFQPRGCASNLKALQIEGRREEAAFRHINQVAAGQIPGIHAGVFQQRPPAAALQCQQSNIGFFEVVDHAADREQNELATGQDIRPSVASLAGSQLSEGNRVASAGRYLRQAHTRTEGSDDVAILPPTGSPAGGSVT